MTKRAKRKPSLRELRLRLKTEPPTIDTLAKLVGISGVTLSLAERGQRYIVSLDTKRKLAKALGVSMKVVEEACEGAMIK